MHRYKCFNSAMATTAATAKVTTGTAIKTMLQIATLSTRQIQLISWGFATDGSGPTGSGIVELIQTDVAATTGTAHVAAGVQPLDPNAPASLVQLGAALTAFTMTVEGTTTASRIFDTQFVAAGGTVGNQNMLTYAYQWMPDERPIVAVSRFLRVRVTFATAATNMLTWVVWDE